MSDPKGSRTVADREAAEWHVRLGERPVSAATLEAFRLWRQSTANTEAYRRVEVLWRASLSLAGDQDIAAITRDTLHATTSPPRRSGTRRLIPAAAIAISLAVGTAIVLGLPGRGAYETAVGGQQSVELADGTEVRLDTDSRMRVRYSKGERRVVLERGQAMFRVAHDAGRPFRVEAGDAEVTALGTVFDVRRETTGARVTLVEGAVSVTNGPNRTSWRLTPGEQVRTASRGEAPQRIDTATVTSWTEGRLVFRSVPLRDAVAEINRYLPGKIVLAAGSLETTPVNGIFATGDRDAFVSAVTDLFGLTASSTADGGVRLTTSSASG